MRHTYQTQSTCSTSVEFDLDGGIVRNISFTNGCAGNLAAISRILDGAAADEVIEKCSGIVCGRRGTSCADQLAKAVIAARGNDI